jgi:hypothetical protein
MTESNRDEPYGGYRQPFYPADYALGLQPERIPIVFDHASFETSAALRQNHQLRLSTYKHGNYPGAGKWKGKIPVVTLAGSDMPGFILQPFDGGKRVGDAILVWNEPVWVDPVDYIVYPAQARYWDEQFRRADDADFDWSGQSSQAATPIYDYANQRLFIGVGYPPQTYSPWHWHIEKQVDGVANGTTVELVNFPVYMLPYNVHREENLANRRRNCKVTQTNTAVATAQIRIDSYTQENGIINTAIINLNTAKILNEFFGDSVYFNLELYVLGANGVIYQDTDLYIG